MAVAAAASVVLQSSQLSPAPFTAAQLEGKHQQDGLTPLSPNTVLVNVAGTKYSVGE